MKTKESEAENRAVLEHIMEGIRDLKNGRLSPRSIPDIAEAEFIPADYRGFAAGQIFVSNGDFYKDMKY